MSRRIVVVVTTGLLALFAASALPLAPAQTNHARLAGAFVEIDKVFAILRHSLTSPAPRGASSSMVSSLMWA